MKSSLLLAVSICALCVLAAPRNASAETVESYRPPGIAACSSRLCANCSRRIQFTRGGITPGGREAPFPGAGTQVGPASVRNVPSSENHP
jgi:hypothetical protein